MSDNIKQPPRFAFVLSNPSHKHFRCVVVGDDCIHKIDDVDKFYEALGYTEEIRRTGVMPDEFIWQEFTRDNADASPCCLQAKILEYLIEHSYTFKKEYGAEINVWEKACKSNKIGTLNDCPSCKLHP